MLMDHFLKENDSRSAALAAHEVMLQECNENQLTLAASLLSCLRYLNQPKKNLEKDHSHQQEETDEEKKV
jgi:hypothetical protein